MINILVLENVPSSEVQKPFENPFRNSSVGSTWDARAHRTLCPLRCSMVARGPPTSDSNEAIEQDAFQQFTDVS